MDTHSTAEIIRSLPALGAFFIIMLGIFGIASARDILKLVIASAVIVFGTGLLVFLLGTDPVAGIGPLPKSITAVQILEGTGLAVFLIALGSAIRKQYGSTNISVLRRLRE